MGRSKKSWDHLVDYHGNYGINVGEGYFPGSPNRPGIKGNLGEKGFKGDKGISGDTGDKGLKGDEGDKGEVGPFGEGPKGEKGAAAGLFLFQGVVDDTNQLPLFNQQPGYSYYVKNESTIYVWDGENWVPMQDVLAPIKGDKGENGEQGFDGPPGNDGLDGARGFDGLKGEKGTAGDDLLLDDYYNKGDIDAIIDGFTYPEHAFHVSFNTRTNSTIEITGQVVDFQSRAQTAPVYNIGLVTIGQRVTVLNSPVPADRLMVVNYVVEDPGEARGLDYTILQFVYNGAPYETDSNAYYRRARPGMGEFSDWRKVSFNEQDYYTKGDVDDLLAKNIRKYELKTFPHPDENVQRIRLEELNSTFEKTDVEVRGVGGIKITRNQNVLTWDASPLTGQILLLGMIDAPDDPYVKRPNANPGEYYIYNVGGTAWNGDDVAAGDWVIFGADPEVWNNVDMTQNYGVLNVSVEGGLLEQTGTVNFPNIILEEDTIREKLLYEYLTFDQTAAIFAGQGIQDHNNVIIETRNNGTEGLYNVFRRTPDLPSQIGEFGVVPDDNEIRFYNFDAHGADMVQLAAQAQVGVTHRFEGLAGQGGTYDGVIVDAGSQGSYFYVRYDNVAVVAMVAAAGEFTVKAYDGLLAENGDSLLYDDTTNLWMPGEAGAGTFVRLEGDTMEGELNMDDNPITGLPYDPPTDDSAVSKKWVLDQLDNLPNQSVPVGVISFWISADDQPAGYLRLDGDTFSIQKYPKLHTFLARNFHGYSTGTLPKLDDHWLGQVGRNNGLNPGRKVDYLTSLPKNDFKTNNTGAHTHKFGIAGQVSGDKSDGRMYHNPTSGLPTSSAGAHEHKIASGGDAITRPPSLTGYWIIKHD